MKIKKLAVTAAFVTTTLGATVGVAGAAPADGADAINFTTKTTEKSTVIQTDAGALVVEDGAFKIKAANGTVLAGTELKFRVDDFEFPIAAEITDRTATLTPQLGVEHAVYKPVALPFDNQAPWKTQYEREQAAWSRLTSTISMGAAIGTLVGGLGGGAVGCILGGIAGATIASAAIIGLFGAFLPAAAIGCFGGLLAMGSIGTLAGQILITAPIAIMAGIQYFTTINEPAPNPQPAK